MKILLDTNFLLLPFTLKIDIFSQFRALDPRASFFVLDRTMQELSYLLQKGTGKNKAAAKMAQELVERFKIKVIQTEERFKNVDQVLVDSAAKYSLSVATQDRALQLQLKKEHIPVYRLRQKKYVQVV